MRVPPARRTATTLAENAYQEIRRRILRGVLPIGSTLSRRKLAEVLGMSQLPVSAALQRLESEGLVETKARAGTRVRVPTQEDIRDSHVLREALESQAARLFAINATKQERRQLRRRAQHTDALFNRCTEGTPDPEFLFDAHTYHQTFHLYIAECARSKALVRALHTNQVLTFNWFLDVAVRHRKGPSNAHRELSEVLSGNDPDAADRALRRHIAYGLEGFLNAVVPQQESRWRTARSV